MNLSIPWLNSCPYCNAINRAETRICHSCKEVLHKKEKKVGNYKKPLKDEQYEQIIKLYNAGWSLKEITQEIADEKYSDEEVRPGGRGRSLYNRIYFLITGKGYRKKYFHRINKNRKEIKELQILHRFHKDYEIRENCWVWKGDIASNGKKMREYPVMFYFNRKMARRYSYERIHGPLRKDQVVTFTCSNHLCVNPEHLKVVLKLEFQIERGKRLRDIGHLANRKKVELIGAQTGKNIFFSSVKEASKFLKTSRDMLFAYNGKSKPFKGYFIKY